MLIYGVMLMTHHHLPNVNSEITTYKFETNLTVPVIAKEPWRLRQSQGLEYRADRLPRFARSDRCLRHFTLDKTLEIITTIYQEMQQCRLKKKVK